MGYSIKSKRLHLVVNRQFIDGGYYHYWFELCDEDGQCVVSGYSIDDLLDQHISAEDCGLLDWGE